MNSCEQIPRSNVSKYYRNILLPVVRSGLAGVTGSVTGEEIGCDVRGAVDTSLDNRNSARTLFLTMKTPEYITVCKVMLHILLYRFR